MVDVKLIIARTTRPLTSFGQSRVGQAAVAGNEKYRAYILVLPTSLLISMEVG